MVSSERQMSREEKIALLTQILNDEEWYSHNHLPVIEGFLDDPDDEVRALAVKCLWNYPEPELIDHLLDLAKTDPSQKVRSRALVTLGRYVYEGEMADYDFDWGASEELMRAGELPREDFERVRDFLIAVHTDESESLESRRFALEALSFWSDPAVWPLIEQAYHHPDPAMQISAIFAMGRNGHRRWADILLRELASPIPERQFEAVRAVGACFLEAAAPQLMDIIETTEDRDVLLEAIYALGRVGGDEAFEVLDELSDSEDEEIQEMVQLALEEWYTYHGLADWPDLGWDDEEWDEP